MPESELREGAPPAAGSPKGSRTAERGKGEGPGELVDRLAKAVERLLEEFEAARRRAESAEAAHGRLAEALRDAGGGGGEPEEVERRLQDLSEENRRLRDVVEEAGRRARRLQNRLRAVEDEL